MIVSNLQLFEDNFTRLMYQATALSPKLSCLSGLVSSKLLSKYTESIIEDFCDDSYLEENAREFTIDSPHYALTEMRAFRHLISKQSLSIGHASDLATPLGYFFDDCICQPQGFEFKYSLPDLRKTKNIYTQNGHFFCRQSISNPLILKAATINCSWMSLGFYQWIYQNYLYYATRPRYLRHRLRHSRIFDLIKNKSLG